MSRRALGSPRERGQLELSTSARADESGLSTAPSVDCGQPAQAAECSIAVREVLGLPIRLLREMPLPTTLVCSFAHEDGCVLLATASPASVPGDPPAPVFVGPEVDALALAAEHGRATMRAWCAKKPAWRLTSVEAIGKLGHRVDPLGWTTEQVLWALGLRLDEVWL